MLLESQTSEISNLRRFSALIGSNPLLVQASTGNTSLKVDGVLWIKASGKWLINAERDEFFVGIDLAAVQACIRQSRDCSALCGIPSGEPLQASIETTMHAVLPHRVVVHVHSVNAIAWAVRKDARAELTLRLAGLSWQWIPYVPSGLLLAREIEKALSSCPEASVLILGNHGLVLCGESCEEVGNLLDDVERRLSICPRSAREPDYARLESIAASTQWIVPECAPLHALATDDVSRKILAGGVLYPCQAIFLSGTTPLILQAGCERQGKPDPFRIVENSGVLLNEEICRSEFEMLMGLAQIVQRIDGDTALRYLSEFEVSGVLNREAHIYRRLADSNCNNLVASG